MHLHGIFWSSGFLSVVAAFEHSWLLLTSVGAATEYPSKMFFLILDPHLVLASAKDNQKYFNIKYFS